jgi:hypothetical protein
VAVVVAVHIAVRIEVEVPQVARLTGLRLTGSSLGNAPLGRPMHLTGYEQTHWNR